MAEIVDFGLQKHKIKMDSRYFDNVLSVVAGDTGRRIEVQLLDTNGMVQNTTGLNLRLNAVVEGKATYTDATLADAATGKYQLDLSNGMFIAPGDWQFQWQITDSVGKKINSFAFTGRVGINISEGGNQATNFYLNAEELRLKTIELQTDFDKLGTQFKKIIDETTGKDVISAPEIIAARKGEASLNARLTKNEQETTAQFQQKANQIFVDTMQTYFENKFKSIIDGSPKGVEPTFEALKLKYPTKTSGVYVVTADNNWYFWLDDFGWTSGGVYQGVELKDSAVTFSKLGDDVKSKINNYLQADDIVGTTQEIITSNDNIVKINHKKNNGTILREDYFNYSPNLIVETRTLESGNKIIYHYRLDTFSTQILSQEKKLYENEIKYTRESWKEWVGKGSSTIESGFLKVANPTSNINLSIPTNLKKNTKYGILFSVRENTRNNSATVITGSGGSYPFPNAVSVPAGETGFFKSIQTTNDYTTSADLRGAITANSGKLVFGDIRIIELPTGSLVERDFNLLSPSLLNRMYEWSVL